MPQQRREPSRFLVEDFFKIAGRGVVLCGRVETGVIRKGAAMALVGDGRTLPVTVQEIAMFKREELREATPLPHDSGKAPYALVVTGIVKEDVRKGDVLTDPSTPPRPVRTR